MYRLIAKFKICAVEAFCIVFCVFPNAVKWLYRSTFSKQIISYPLEAGIGKFRKTAKLYLHGFDNTVLGDKPHAVLLLHGDYGHPFTMLPLADIANKANIGPIFSLYLPFDRAHSKISQELITQAVDVIQAYINERGGNLNGIIVGGHSKGGTQAAYQQFVSNDQRIKTVIAFSAPLKAVDSLKGHFDVSLKFTVDRIYEAIQTRPDVSLYQIVAGNDWCCPREAMVVRADHQYCRIIVGAMHLNMLYHHETYAAFDEFLKKSVV